jgi:hypothetical protein
MLVTHFLELSSWTSTSTIQGSNAFLFHGPKDHINTQGLLQVLSEALNTNLPTRFVCLVPSQEKIPSHFLELATFHQGSPLFGGFGTTDFASTCPMSLILAANKESLLIDPINWGRLVERLQNWSVEKFISIPKTTDALFRERENLSHPPRSISKHPKLSILNDCSLMNFYDPFAPMENSTNVASIPPPITKLINRMNRHPRALSLLGILPNQLRTLLKETDHKDRETALFDLSRSLLLAGFGIWKKRQNLASRFWHDIAPTNEKRNNKERKKRKKTKDDEIASSKCKNPFHFLRRYCNLSNKRRTKCHCSNVPITAEIPNKKLTYCIIRHKPSSSTTLSNELNLRKSRADKIRAQHDRGKRKRKRTHKSATKHSNSKKRNDNPLTNFFHKTQQKQ